MKAIFLCDDNGSNINRIYTQELCARLKKTVDIDCDIIISKDNISKYKELAQLADYAFSTWGMPSFSEEEIKEYFPNLKAVFYGAGSVQGFARPFLNRCIAVHSAWAANAVPVAEYTVSQILLANKGFFQGCLMQSRGEHSTEFYASFPGNYDCKVGIIGAGMIGKLVIKLLKDYNIEVLVFDPFLNETEASLLGVKKCSLEDIFKDCQTISNHLANNNETKGMLNYDLFSKMKHNATFINTGRGAQVVEEHLIKVLCENPSMTAVLDVTDPEPPVKDSPFYSLPNVFLTPHIAGSSGNEVRRMGQFMIEELERIVNGEQVKYSVTLEMLKTMA